MIWGMSNMDGLGGSGSLENFTFPVKTNLVKMRGVSELKG
jgi:hypothetical protein